MSDRQTSALQQDSSHKVFGHRAAALFLIYMAIALVSQIETLLIPPRMDSAAYLFQGLRQAHGQMPGRDLWDNKLPLIYLVGRTAMASGTPQLFLWLIEAVLTACGALAITAMLRGEEKGTKARSHEGTKISGTGGTGSS